MNNTVRSVLWVLAGIVSIGLSIYCFNMDAGEYCSDSIYGGDAFTGIQNASATAARNVKTLTKVVKAGFGSILLVGGIALIAFSIQVKKEEKNIVSTTDLLTTNNKETATVVKPEEVSTNNEQSQNKEENV